MISLKKMLQDSLLLQWLVILVLLVVVRGGEGLFEPLSLDVNDTVVFSEIAANPDFPEDSISAQFVSMTGDVGVALLPGKLMHAAGISPENQYLVVYALQMSLLALSLLVFFSAFGRDFSFILLAVLLAYVSAFSGFGRYLAIGAGFKIVSSGMALAAGFFILGLHLRGMRTVSAVIAALLAAYHPTHAFVLLSMLGCHALWETFYARTLSFAELMRIGAVTTAALLPFVFLFILKMPPHQEFDHGAWWSYVLSKSSNLTPLQDGVLVVTMIMATLVLGTIALRARAAHEVNTRAIGIIAVTIVLWTVQITVSEIFRSVSFTQLALTRATPYAVMVIVALLAWYVHRAFIEGNARDKFAGLLLVLGSMGAGLPSRLPFLGVPTITPPLVNTELFFQSQIVNHAALAIIVAALAWWMWLPILSEETRVRLTRALTFATIFCVIFFGLRTPFLAVGIILLMYYKPAVFSKLTARPVLIYGFFAIAVATVLIARSPWNVSRGHEIKGIMQAVETHVPLDGMILTVPFHNNVSEFLIPSRATFLGWSESQYLFYAPSLATQVWKRAALLGVQPVDSDPACGDWLWKPMCRRQLFAARAEEPNNAWRGNLREMKKLAPSLSHVLMPTGMICAGDKILAQAGDLVLVPLRGVAQCAE
ncbi:MAG: hypothetical protein WBK55_05940 [Alphaproteobacteria bacterium]